MRSRGWRGEEEEGTDSRVQAILLKYSNEEEEGEEEHF